MKFRIGSLLLACTMPFLGGCFGTISSGNVGVVKDWNGQVQTELMPPGFYTNFTTSVREYSGRQIHIGFNGLKPKASDNLTLQDFDADIYYSTKKDAISGLAVKYANDDAYDDNAKVWYAAYELVSQTASSSIYTVVSQYDSLQIHKERDDIASKIRDELQRRLEAQNPGTFTVDNVIINNVVTDPSVEAAIKRNVEAQKELQTQQIQFQINEQIAKNNEALTKSITPAILAQKQLDVLNAMVANGNIRPIVMLNMSGDGKSTMPIIQLQPGGK